MFSNSSFDIEILSSATIMPEKKAFSLQNQLQSQTKWLRFHMQHHQRTQNSTARLALSITCPNQLVDFEVGGK
jgi:hypothetical protein